MPHDRPHACQSLTSAVIWQHDDKQIVLTQSCLAAMNDNCIGFVAQPAVYSAYSMEARAARSEHLDQGMFLVMH